MLANFILFFYTCILKAILNLVLIQAKFNKVGIQFVLSWSQMILQTPITFYVNIGMKKRCKKKSWKKLNKVEQDLVKGD